eukprot:TRINITY_DN385_c0_g7_i1.p1 TRINITY_DN385_c0_g7~~TRINITY_DN385_c0_g7_i1.p1  ORF type:complete len:230 (-),score=48.08 TRINITY_DN385_c0_g7_i1:106-795(-)
MSTGKGKGKTPAGPQIIYSFVAKGQTVLAEYSTFTGNFSAIAAECLKSLPTTNSKLTYPHSPHALNYLIQDGYAYMALTDEGYPKATTFAFLDRIRADFESSMKSKAASAQPLGLNKEYGPKLKEHMKFVLEHPEEMNKLAKIQAQVSEVKGVMRDNIDKVLQRGEKFESLVEKTDDLREKANIFQKRTTEIRSKMWYENLRTKMVIIILFVILGLIIWVSICNGFTCS